MLVDSVRKTQYSKKIKKGKDQDDMLIESVIKHQLPKNWKPYVQVPIQTFPIIDKT